MTVVGRTGAAWAARDEAGVGRASRPEAFTWPAAATRSGATSSTGGAVTQAGTGRPGRSDSGMRCAATAALLSVD
ncbi:hypothetical protein ASF75_00395 [Curtobacterium sp. Leaf154]|nr:hypothetical protein ASF75_00395 [Curtobacterium sp. Leaf154]